MRTLYWRMWRQNPSLCGVTTQFKLLFQLINHPWSQPTTKWPSSLELMILSWRGRLRLGPSHKTSWCNRLSTNLFRRQRQALIIHGVKTLNYWGQMVTSSHRVKVKSLCRCLCQIWADQSHSSSVTLKKTITLDLSRITSTWALICSWIRQTLRRTAFTTLTLMARPT